MEPNTFLLDEREVVWLDLMYSLLPLKSGEILSVSAIYPENLETRTLNIDVRPATENIQINETNYAVFICDTGSPAQVHYVTQEGQLVQVELPEEDVTIQLTKTTMPDQSGQTSSS